ncbi:MAG: PUR family DNA/RNA-binding protein [Bacteroidales bacterium]|nr:PUR family DNA/RNA-binding protein [Bacteroidales bacterium]
MHNDDYQDGSNNFERSAEDVFSKPVRAGKRTYFFDVKATRGGDFYLTITESKRKVERDGSFTYDKHKIFLYKEDFEKFSEGLADVIDYIRRNGTKPDYNGPENEGGKSGSGERNFSGVDFEEL